MIDFNDMNKRQQEGLIVIDSLEEDENQVLRHYCSLASEALMKMGAKQQSPIDQMVINAYKYGIALGLRLQATKGKLYSRPE